jgi:hypothetical protein
MSQKQSHRGIKPSRIPQNMEAATQLIRGTNTTDIIITFVIPILAIVGLMYFSIITMIDALIWFGIMIAGNFVLYKLLPNEASILYWLKSINGYTRQAKTTTKHNHEIEDGIEIEYLSENTGGRDPSAGNMFDFLELEETTTETTLIDEIDMTNGVIKLIDGSFVAGVSVSGMGIRLADESMQMDAIQKFERALNTINYPITVRGTSRQFQIESVIERYGDRLEDDDIQRRPIMARLARNRQQFLQQQIKPMGMNSREYHVMIRVSQEDDAFNDGVFSLSTIIDPTSPAGEWLREKNLGLYNSDSAESVEEELITTAQKRAESVGQAIGRNRHLNVGVMNGDEIADAIRFFWRRESVKDSEWKPATEISADSSDTSHLHGNTVETEVSRA